MRAPLMLLFFGLQIVLLHAQELYEMPANASSRMSSFENMNGEKGAGGKRNKSAKGHPFELIEAGDARTLLDIGAEGIIQRIWLTIDQNPTKLRALRLRCYWDNASKPAVDVPLGDFFCHNLGMMTRFENAFFSSGEGRSFICTIPMPFRTGARVVLTNEGSETVKLYYDIDYLLKPVSAQSMYFHAYWNRQMTGTPGGDYTILPKVTGKGRLLGVSAGLNTNPEYARSWWGEGEIKMYLDGDTTYPTINGTGAEDYIGSAWGLGTFTNQYQGCQIANDSTGEFTFYRWHVPDEIYFSTDLRVTIQQIGGWDKEQVISLMKNGADLLPVSIDGPEGFARLLEQPVPINLDAPDTPDGWVNFYRIDDYTSVCYFYLDMPSSTLAALPDISMRTADLPKE